MHVLTSNMRLRIGIVSAISHDHRVWRWEARGNAHLLLAAGPWRSSCGQARRDWWHFARCLMSDR